MTSSQNSANDIVHSSLPIGSFLQDRYRIVKQLGRGGMGAVYEAVDQRLGIIVALKETLSTEPSMRKQFEHEARLLASMQHPALPRVSDHFVEGNRAFLVMQFISGSDLGRMLSQQSGPFTCDQVIAWADQLLDALVYLHSRDEQVIHRDIKPHNLKLTASGQIVLLDFGLAKAQPADTSLTASRAFFGYTKHYAPLEQIRDERTDPRTDIYALGATLYHLLTGIKPTDALLRASALLSGDPDPLKPANEIHSLVGANISATLQKAMALKPEERFATASEFREALRRVGVESQQVARIVEETAENIFVKAPQRSAATFNLAMIDSARRFGPGAITFVLLFLGATAAGVMYAAQGWFGPMGSLPQQTTGAATAPSSKPRTNVQSNVVPKTRNQSDTVAEPKTSAVKEDKAEVRTSAKNSFDATSKPAHAQRKVGAPSIKLPDPAEDSVSPHDGTHVVRFSDGSTRVVRVGAKAVE